MQYSHIEKQQHVSGILVFARLSSKLPNLTSSIHGFCSILFEVHNHNPHSISQPIQETLTITSSHPPKPAPQAHPKGRRLRLTAPSHQNHRFPQRQRTFPAPIPTLQIRPLGHSPPKNYTPLFQLHPTKYVLLHPAFSAPQPCKKRRNSSKHKSTKRPQTMIPKISNLVPFQQYQALMSTNL